MSHETRARRTHPVRPGGSGPSYPQCTQYPLPDRWTGRYGRALTDGQEDGGSAMATILISGSGIAGPTLAYWLVRHGNDVTVVERSGALRSSGSPIDVRG